MIKALSIPFFTILCLSALFVAHSQTYYDCHNRVGITLVNDTMAEIVFAEFGGLIAPFSYTTQCRILRSDDTLFLLTNPTWRYRIHLYRNKDAVKVENVSFLPNTKIYNMQYYPTRHSFVVEKGGWYDSIKKMTFVNYGQTFVDKSLFLILKSYHHYDRVLFYPSLKGCSYIGIEPNPISSYRLILDSLPMIQKGMRLVPVTSVAQLKCWVDNGFLMPVMRKSRKSHSIRPTLYPALQNLSTSRLEDASYPIPKKYIQMLKDENTWRYFPAVIED